MENVFGKVNVFFLTVFIIRHYFPKSKRFLLKIKKFWLYDKCYEDTLSIIVTFIFLFERGEGEEG